MIKRISIFILGIAVLQQASAENPGLGTWNILNMKYGFNDRWSAFGEAQLRSLRFYTQFHYYEIKGGASYKANNSLILTLGAGTYQTYKEGGNFVLPKNNDEIRIWPQVVLLQTIGRFKIEQRYRAEMRFTSNGYRNRYRYRLGVALPFGTARNGQKRFLASVSNELFFTDREPYFERNRFQAAMSIRLSEASIFQFGYIQQFDYRINDETGRDFLLLGYFIELGGRNQAVADPASRDH